MSVLSAAASTGYGAGADWSLCHSSEARPAMAFNGISNQVGGCEPVDASYTALSLSTREATPDRPRSGGPAIDE